MAGLCLIFNPQAGQGRAGAQLATLQAFAVSHPGVELALTRSPGEAEELARQAAARSYDVVAVAGGDGTINEVVNGLMDPDRPPLGRPILGLVPLGSANDLARGLGLDDRPAEALARIMRGRSRAIDVGRVENGVGSARYFAFSLGVGFVGAVAAERFRVRHIHGPWLYLWAGLRALRYYEPRAPLHVRYDGRQTRHRRLMFLSVNNVRSVGGFPLTPAAEMDDGLFDVLSARYVRWTKRPRLLLLAWRGRHLDAPEFELIRCRRLEITVAEPLPVHVDGELYGASHGDESHLRIELIPKALRVLV